jgi:hypothetical protein
MYLTDWLTGFTVPLYVNSLNVPAELKKFFRAEWSLFPNNTLYSTGFSGTLDLSSTWPYLEN